MDTKDLADVVPKDDNSILITVDHPLLNCPIHRSSKIFGNVSEYLTTI